MKNLFLILLAAIFIAGCSDNGEDANSGTLDNEETSAAETEGKNAEEEKEKKDVYQIGETADITSTSFGFPYQVTVNSMELSTEDVDGLSLEDLNYSAEEGGRFVVVNVTLKNTSDSAFIPKEKISAFLNAEDNASFSTEEQPFQERYEELAPGEEITGNMVYTSSYFDEFDVLYLTYEDISKEETRFEIPIPEE